MEIFQRQLSLLSAPSWQGYPLAAIQITSSVYIFIEIFCWNYLMLLLFPQQNPLCYIFKRSASRFVVYHTLVDLSYLTLVQHRLLFSISVLVAVWHVHCCDMRDRSGTSSLVKHNIPILVSPLSTAPTLATALSKVIITVPSMIFGAENPLDCGISDDAVSVFPTSKPVVKLMPFVSIPPVDLGFSKGCHVQSPPFW